MKKILTVLGARPQFIKASVVSNAIFHSDELKEVLVHTGQHFDANMSDIFFAELGMNKPDYLLDIHGGSHGSMTGKMLIQLEQVMQQEKPDIVLVYGDTNSTLAGALAAVKLHIPIAHVEAGLRSFNMDMPEEVNRILTDRMSHWLFTPTDAAAEHLINEGCSPEIIYPVGDVMFDVAMFHGARVKSEADLLVQLGLKDKPYILVTVHRAENTDNPTRLIAIVDALIKISNQMPIVWPLHPRTRDVLNKLGKLETMNKKINLIEPVGYLEMVQLEKYASLIATDSGGVQKEAFFYKVPCVTMRNETEWVELIDAGWNRLAPPMDAATIVSAIEKSLGTSGNDVTPYGRGDTAEKIVLQLEQH
jgi:UDP-GlcNAc3NAcA epimerase